jgi:pyridoxine 5'-phosphate synthase PdxJ
MAAKLSVNINKYALLRNSRGHDTPNLLWATDVCLAAGAYGITVHPRADQRHVRFDDVPVLAEHLRARHAGVELNVECEASDALLALVERVQPDQCTLVPVRPGEVTSDHGYQAEDVAALRPMVARLRALGIRVSLFSDCEPDTVRALAATGAQRVELYTGPYAWAFGTLPSARAMCGQVHMRPLKWGSASTPAMISTATIFAGFRPCRACSRSALAMPRSAEPSRWERASRCRSYWRPSTRAVGYPRPRLSASLHSHGGRGRT